MRAAPLPRGTIELCAWTHPFLRALLRSRRDDAVTREEQGSSPVLGHPSMPLFNPRRQQCALALGGECTITFEETRTVFRLSCPVNARRVDDELPDFQLPMGTICIGIDDSSVQRFILAKIFSTLGAPPENVHIFGSTDDEILSVASIIARLVRAHKGSKVFVIGDENLDLSEGCACTTVSCSQAFEELRKELEPQLLQDVLLVVRSANDSRSDTGAPPCNPCCTVQARL